MPEQQLDLFSAGGVVPERPRASRRPDSKLPADCDNAALLAAIPEAGVTDGPALAAEAGRRRLAAAIPILEDSCRRFAGFGLEHPIPEQVAALRALGEIGGRPAAQAVVRLISRKAVEGPTLRTALAVAARLGADLPADSIVTLLRHADPKVRAAACRCVWPPLPRAIPVLIELLDDLNQETTSAAACALGRIGRPEARPTLHRLLREAPSRDIIDALAPVADDECVVLLGRVAGANPDLAATVLEALDVIDTPRSARIAQTIVAKREG